MGDACGKTRKSISIHAPRAGRDRCGLTQTQGGKVFQSTRPVRGATVRVVSVIIDGKISIHAPRAGRDGGCGCRLSQRQDFNPRAPCGARRDFREIPEDEEGISIHAPRAGRDKGVAL